MQASEDFLVISALLGFFGLFPLWVDSPLCRILLSESLSASILLRGIGSTLEDIPRVFEEETSSLWLGGKFCDVIQILWIEVGSGVCPVVDDFLSSFYIQLLKAPKSLLTPQLFSFTFGFSLSLLTL